MVREPNGAMIRSPMPGVTALIWINESVSLLMIAYWISWLAAAGSAASEAGAGTVSAVASRDPAGTAAGWMIFSSMALSFGIGAL